MKKTALVSSLLLSVAGLMVACSKQAVQNDEKQTVSLYTCREQVSGLPGTRICLDSIVADARCPEGVVCFWAGYAIVKVSFYENNSKHLFRMSLWEQPFTRPYFSAVHDTTINGYKIVFTELTATNKPLSDVQATFEVSR